MTKPFILFPLLAAFALLACKPRPAPVMRHPPENMPQQLAPGVQRTAMTLDRGGTPMRLWFYLPTPLPSPQIPCVLIAPAGSRLFHGMELADGDCAEHIPWVRKGFAVAAFEIDGPMDDKAIAREVRAAIDAFRAAHAGIDDARAAFDYAASRPEVDMNRIYIVGHSSAATLALQAAEHDPRIAGCVAFAPACDLPARLEKAAPFIDNLRPGTMDFLADLSPNRRAPDLACPTLLFTARDDSNVPSASVQAFAAQLQTTNPHVKLITVNSGGHYQSMIDKGIPAAIDFLQSLSIGKK